MIRQRYTFCIEMKNKFEIKKNSIFIVGTNIVIKISKIIYLIVILRRGGASPAHLPRP